MLACLLLVGSPVDAQSASPGDYDTDDDGLIEISTLEQLDAVRYDLDGDGVPDLSDDQADYSQAFPSLVSGLGCPADGCEGYELTRDLDFNDPSSYASGSVDRGWSRGERDEGWLPIGIHFERFSSTFDGNGHTIANLFIDRTVDYVGLFGGISAMGALHDFGLVDATVRGGATVGPLAGGNDGLVIGCYATGSVSGIDSIGGLVGANGDQHHGKIIGSYADVHVSGNSFIGGFAGTNHGTIIGSHATGTVSGTNTVGGLAGWNGGPIGTSYATGNVSGGFSVGGLVGKNSLGGVIISSYAASNVSGGGDGHRVGGLVGQNFETIRGSYSTGNVSGGSTVGGLVGLNAHGTVTSSYAIGAVSGTGGIGGLVGHNYGNSVVIGSYAIGSVAGVSNVGGLAGSNDRSDGISASYWDFEASGQANGVGGGFTSGAEGKTTAGLQSPTSYAGIYRNWNTDIDDADGDGFHTTGTDDPWHFGTDDQYPALRADVDGDGKATWEEFGIQRGVGPPPSETEVPPQPEMDEPPPAPPSPSCSNGIVVENPQENPGLVGDCKVLLAGRDTLAGSATLNWSTALPIHRWQGITVDGSPRRVVELRHDSADLSGRIPPQLGSLSDLRVLSFRINDLFGGIPPELAGLSELRSLDLHGNQRLGGTIPPELGRLSKLEQLDLNATGLTGAIPPELGKLSNLESLRLGQNRLNGSIPLELSSLSSLKILSLYATDLTGAIPRELADLPRLENLWLRANRLTGSIPPELGQLSTLRTLNLSENMLTGRIPQSLATLSSLNSLWLGRNRLSGEIPTWLSEIRNLQFLDLSDNQLTGAIPTEIADLSILVYLYLHNNNLTGTIPRELGNLSLVTALLLSNNQLTGEIPPELGNLSKLESLALSHNNLTGAIPRDLGNLSNLLALYLQGNRLTGTIPAGLGNLAKLQALYLNNNSLTGSLPTELTALSSLVQLHVAGNDLTACVPWHLAHKLTLNISHDGLPRCPPPVAEGGMFSVEASRLLDDERLTIVAVGDAVNGTVSLDGSTIVYTHDGSESATDSFTYTVIDGIRSSMVTVTVTVIPVNDPPIAVADTATVDEGGMLSIAALDNDSDAEDDTLTITAVGNAVNGRAWLEGTSIRYEHDGSESDTDTFSYVISDGTDIDTATVMITVRPVNDLPVAVSDATSVDEGDALAIAASTLLANDTDAENDTLSITAVGDAVNGTVSLDGTTITYTHDGSETTSGGFTYIVTDGTDTDTTRVMITVRPVNDPPIAAPDTATVDEGGMLSIGVLDNDTDAESDTLRITAVGDALSGTVSPDGTTITYTHDGSETNTGSFTYTVGDGTDADTAMVTITVTPVNDPPIAVADTAEVDEGHTLSVEASALLANDTDAENDTLSITTVGVAVNGTVSLNGSTITLHARRLRDDRGQLLLHRQRRRRHCHRHGGDYSSARGRCAGCRRRDGHGDHSDTCGSRGNGAADGRCARCGRREGHSHHSDACGSGNGESDTWVCGHTPYVADHNPGGFRATSRR